MSSEAVIHISEERSLAESDIEKGQNGLPIHLLVLIALDRCGYAECVVENPEK